MGYFNTLTVADRALVTVAFRVRGQYLNQYTPPGLHRSHSHCFTLYPLYFNHSMLHCRFQAMSVWLWKYYLYRCVHKGRVTPEKKYIVRPLNIYK